jgi:glycosyl transferase family 25
MDDVQIALAQLNSFFDHIYVISLHRATDRHERLQKELAGLKYEIFWGKDKNEFDVEQLKKENIYNEEMAIKCHRYNKKMVPGMIGCSWSHRLIYEDILKNNYGKVLILEDDVVIDVQTISILDKILTELPKDWELFYLGFALNEPPIKATIKKWYYHFVRLFGIIKLSHKEIANRLPKKISAHIYKAGYHDCTHAYAITNSCAKKFVKLQTPIIFWPDHLLAYASTNEIIRSYVTMPKTINQVYQVTEIPTHSYINH